MMRLLLALVLVIGSLLVSLPSSQAEPAVSMTLRVGFAGDGKLGGWIPVDVVLSNEGDDVSGEIHIETPSSSDRGAFNRPPTIYTVPVSLPARSEKRFTANVFLPGPSNRVQASFVAGDTTLAQQTSDLSVVSGGELLCAVITQDEGFARFLTRVNLADRRRGVRAVVMDPVDLPDRPEVLASLDCLIVTNVPLSGLVEEQKRALAAWVDEGGLLVLAAGAGSQRVLTALPEYLSPVRVSGLARVSSLSTLQDLTGDGFPGNATWLVPSATLDDGATILEQDGIPVMAGMRRGDGSVIFLGLDPAVDPLRNWGGNEALWRFILSHSNAPFASPTPLARPNVSWGRVPRNALASMPPLEAPSPVWPLALLAGYVLIIGPLNYLVLRRFGGLHWGILTIPVIILLGTFIAVSLGRAFRASDLAISDVTLARAAPNAPSAATRSYVGVFSPRAGEYKVTVGKQGLASPLFYPFPRESSSGNPNWQLKVQADAKGPMVHLKLDNGTLGTVVVDRHLPLNGGIESTLELHGSHLLGVITNRLGQRLDDVALVLGNDVYRIGALAANGSAEIDFPITVESGPVDPNALVGNLASAGGGPLDAVRQDILQAALVPTPLGGRVGLTGLNLIGWTERPLAPFELTGGITAVRSNLLLVAELPLRFAPGHEMVIPRALVESQSLFSLGSRVAQDGSYDLSSGGSLVLHFDLPVPPARFAVDNLNMHVSATFAGASRRPAPQFGDTLFFNWRTQDWEGFTLAFGDNTIGAPTRFISDLGGIRVRYTFRPPFGTTFSGVKINRFDLSVRGRPL